MALRRVGLSDRFFGSSLGFRRKDGTDAALLQIAFIGAV